MRKILFAILAVLFVAGLASAHTMVVSPTEGPFKQVIPVYNSGASAIDAGDVVVWEIDDSTGDNDAYVQTTTTADTALVAGVAEIAIAVGDEGYITIYGTTTCDTFNGVGSNGPLCTSSTAGAGRACQNDDLAYGFCTAASASNSCTCFVNP